ncbi:hypothetical protein Mapa_011729 [Marchantia paleacea]|nr:hypothetical protein Mapa_011729 [Marchantia paleacea]
MELDNSLWSATSLSQIVSKFLELICWICYPSREHLKLPGPESDPARDNSELPVLDSAEWKSEELFQLYDEGDDVTVIFFHGPCRVRDSPSYLHISSWTTEDTETGKSVLWPKEWLVEEFPKSRIYTVKYDSSIRVTSTVGRSSELYILGENMIHSVIRAFKPDFWLNPVVLVGHSFGGIVIKQLIVAAHRRLDRLRHEDVERETIRNFLDHVKLIFYYSTPHHGMNANVDRLHVAVHNRFWTSFWKTSRIIGQYGAALNKDLARLNEDFKAVSDKNDWVEAGVGEKWMTRWESIRYHGVVVPEASSTVANRSNYIVIDADHFSVCRPVSKSASGFQFLVSNMKIILPDSKDSQGQTSARLNPGQVLRAGDSRTSANGVYKLVMQNDGNLVLFEEGEGSIWESNTACDTPNCYCIMQTDGNAVIYGGSRRSALWSSGTWGCNDATRYMEIRDDGNIVMYNEEGHVAWHTNTSRSRWTSSARLTAGQIMKAGESRSSSYGGYTLTMRKDCNLVLSHRVQGRLWASNTVRHVKNPYFTMQSDGNAVIYPDVNEHAVWATMCFCKKPGTHYLEVQADGNVVVYDDNRQPKWASNTWRLRSQCVPRLTSGESMYGGDSRESTNRIFRLLMHDDGSLQLFRKGHQGPIWASTLASPKRKCYFTMHPDGNAVIYDGTSRKPLWSTPSHSGGCSGTFYIEVEDDGNVVLYDSERNAHWATNTR